VPQFSVFEESKIKRIEISKIKFAFAIAVYKNLK